MAPFLAAFTQRSRDTAAALAVGALLAIGPRTVTNCLRALGLAEHSGFTAFHRVLNRNVWSGLALGRTLLRLLVPVFEPGRPFVIIGVDHTLERRRGHRIEPARHFHDAVRSPAKHKITSRGLRWIQRGAGIRGVYATTPTPFGVRRCGHSSDVLAPASG